MIWPNVKAIWHMGSDDLAQWEGDLDQWEGDLVSRAGDLADLHRKCFVRVCSDVKIQL